MDDINAYRKPWLDVLEKISKPILINMAEGELKENMPIEYMDENRIKFAHLEGVGRLICGIAPWLELGIDETSEGKMREEYINLIQKGLINICNPQSCDYLVFDEGHQPIVDVAFLVQGILRAKTQLWDSLDEKELVINTILKSRKIIPWNTNWLLFASMIEAFLLETIGSCDEDRLMHGVNKFLNEWYCGDGFYSDGDVFHFDYYNSFVIHPMLTEILLILQNHGKCDDNLVNIQLNRLKQYSSFLERLISPFGTYPIFGRSMAYRTGVFHALGLSCLLGLYDDNVKPAQVRSALSSVIKNQFSDENFDEGGWLKIGFKGHQLGIAEEYINTGSLYLCSTVFLPLGLSPDDRFWSEPYESCTQTKGWLGKDIKLQKAIND